MAAHVLLEEGGADQRIPKRASSCTIAGSGSGWTFAPSVQHAVAAGVVAQGIQ